MRSFLIGIVLLGIGACSGAAGTESVWSGQRSVLEDVVVPVGAVLTIEPGSEIELAADVSIRVEGTLIAQGEERDPIVFRGMDGDRWLSIRFADSAIDAAFEEIDDYSAGSIVEWAILEDATHAIYLESASPYIHETTFRDNQTAVGLTIGGGAAIRATMGSQPRIRDCTFEDNEAQLVGYGGAVFLEDSDAILQDNVFRRNTSSYGGALATDTVASPIVGNDFEENSTSTEGGGASLISTISAFLNNRLVGNSAGLDGGGLHVCVDCFPHASPFVMDNTIVDNESSDPILGHSAGGFGAAYLRGFTRNTIHGNTRDGEPADFAWFHTATTLHESESDAYPAWVRNPDITNNWWGTTESTEIAGTIFDGADASERGVTTFEPWLDAEPVGAVPRITITTRKQRYIDGESSVETFLSVYNPGEGQSVRITLSAQFDDGEAEPYAPDLDHFVSVGDGVYEATLPANSIFYAALTLDLSDVPEGTEHGIVSAELMEAELDEMIAVSASRFDLTTEVE